MKKHLKTVLDALNSRKWHYNLTEENFAIGHVRGENADYSVSLTADETEFSIACHLPLKIAETRELYEFLGRVNQLVRFGKFGYSVEERRIAFEADIFLGAEGNLTEEQVTFYINCAILSMDSCLHAFVTVAFANSQPEAVMEELRNQWENALSQETGTGGETNDFGRAGGQRPGFGLN